MNLFVYWVISVYARVLKLYPRRFKDAFAVEMHAVFRDSVVDAAEAGILPLLLVCVREFMNMPLSILKEFWHDIQGKEPNMQSTQFSPWQRGSWADSVLAGLPHLLIAVLFTVTGAIVNARLAALSRVIVLLLLLIGFLATIYYTWRNHWPVWSASWYGYVGLIVLLFAILPYQDWSGIGDQIFKGISFVLLLLSLITILYWFSRRNPIEGLLMAMPVIILYWFVVMEFIPHSIRFWLTFWIFLLSTLTAVTITRLNDIRRAVWLVLGASILIGLPIAYARTYWHNIPEGHFSPPTIGQMVELFSVPWLASSALVVGPILGWGLWNFAKRHSKVERACTVIVIIGMAVNLLGHFSYWWSFSHQTFLNALPVSAWYQPTEVSSLSMVFGGLAMILVGAMALAINSWNANKLLSVTLILVPPILPLVAMFPTYFGNYIIPAGFSFQFAQLSEIYKSLILLVGAIWLLTTGWTVTRIYNPPLQEGVL
jgi:hypothetical protein